MHIDYPHKIFIDKRLCYCLLMEALAMDGRLVHLSGGNGAEFSVPVSAIMGICPA